MSHPSGPAAALLISLRPHQWVKNALLFAGIIFGGQITSVGAVLAAVCGFAVFCLASGGVYLFNDIADRAADSQHPVRKHRPLASGRLKVNHAVGMGAVLLALALTGGFLIGYAFGCLVSVYIGQNILYSLVLKRVAILDVMTVALGFVIRAVAGAVAVSSTASPWLVVCSLMLALFVVCGKRRHELRVLAQCGAARRPGVTEYTPELLDLMMAITGCAGVMTYVLYTLSPWAVVRHGSVALSLTVPMVLYGVFRFLYLVHRQNAGGDPSRLFVTDRGLLINGVVWMAVTCFAVHAPPDWLPWWWIEL